MKVSSKIVFAHIRTLHSTYSLIVVNVAQKKVYAHTDFTKLEGTLITTGNLICQMYLLTCQEGANNVMLRYLSFCFKSKSIC